MLVVINPFGGSGRARKLWDSTVLPIFQAAGTSFEVICAWAAISTELGQLAYLYNFYCSSIVTTHGGHGIQIGQTIDINAFEVLVCVSGDGVVHEVINGLGRRPDAGAVLRQLSIASIPAGMHHF